jgi:hypothetical protein
MTFRTVLGAAAPEHRLRQALDVLSRHPLDDTASKRGRDVDALHRLAIEQVRRPSPLNREPLAKEVDDLIEGAEPVCNSRWSWSRFHLDEAPKRRLSLRLREPFGAPPPPHRTDAAGHASPVGVRKRP